MKILLSTIAIWYAIGILTATVKMITLLIKKAPLTRVDFFVMFTILPFSGIVYPVWEILMVIPGVGDWMGKVVCNWRAVDGE